MSQFNLCDMKTMKMTILTLILIVIQRLSKLNKFSKGLRSTKYFDNWTQENLDDTVTWRFED